MLTESALDSKRGVMRGVEHGIRRLGNAGLWLSEASVGERRQGVGDSEERCAARGHNAAAI